MAEITSSIMDDDDNNNVTNMDVSVLFHEDMDESRLSNYDYSMKDAFDAEDPHAFLKNFDNDRRASICSLGQSLRDNYIPRNFCEEEESESSESSSEEEEELPARPSRRGLLVSTKSARPSLESTKDGGGGGGVWKSMRSLGMSKDHEGGESSGSVWRSMRSLGRHKDSGKEETQPLMKMGSFKWNTKGTPLEDESDSKHQDNDDDEEDKGSKKEGEVEEDEDDDEDFPVPRMKPQRTSSGLKPMMKMGSFKWSTKGTPLGDDSDADNRHDTNNNDDDKAKSDKEAAPEEGEDAPRMKRDSAPSRVRRAVSPMRFRKSLSKDTAEENERPSGRPGLGLKKAASFRFKRSSDSANAPIEMPELKRASSSTNNKALAREAPTSRMMLKKAASFKISRKAMSLALDPSNEEKEESPASKLKRTFSGSSRARNFKIGAPGEAPTSIMSLKRAASKKSMSADPTNSKDSLPVLKKASSSSKLKSFRSFGAMSEPSASRRGNLKKAASFKMKRSSMDPAAEDAATPRLRKSTSFVRTKPVAPSA